MKTTINNNHRIFLLTGDFGKHFICNIEDFKACFNEFEDKDSIKIQHLWNNNFTNCSRKSVVDMAESLSLQHPFDEMYLYKVTFKGRFLKSIGKPVRQNITKKCDFGNGVHQIHLYTEFELISNFKVKRLN